MPGVQPELLEVARIEIRKGPAEEDEELGEETPSGVAPAGGYQSLDMFMTFLVLETPRQCRFR